MILNLRYLQGEYGQMSMIVSYFYFKQPGKPLQFWMFWCLNWLHTCLLMDQYKVSWFMEYKQPPDGFENAMNDQNTRKEKQLSTDKTSKLL